jgi:quercetin dioxygenase-like cupin family protein
MQEELNRNEVLRKIAFSDKKKEEILRQCRAVVASWGLSLPRVEPDVLHFALNNFSEIGETEFDIVNNVDEGYCGKFIFMFRGQTCPAHHHRLKHETFFIVKGAIEMKVDEKEKFQMLQGDKYVIDRGRRHEFKALEDTLILESSTPDLIDDSIFAKPQINEAIFGKNGL